MSLIQHDGGPGYFYFQFERDALAPHIPARHWDGTYRDRVTNLDPTWYYAPGTPENIPSAYVHAKRFPPPVSTSPDTILLDIICKDCPYKGVAPVKVESFPGGEHLTWNCPACGFVDGESYS